ncbi:DMT family transporter, partial [Prevotella sp.]|uniref:DMT family transporter n=1 Tax=Prevotella sp. TaxID=59823 RepID=UPI0027E2DF1F
LYIHIMDAKLRGTVCGIAAAVFYGTNPLGAMNLYADGISTNSTLFYRFGIAVIILGVMMALQRKSFALTRRELATLAILGVFMSTSSTTLYFSFNFMDVGIASTLLFVYPVMVAVIMATFFHEKVTAATVIAILLSLAGIALLNQTGDGTSLSLWGVTLVMLSSLTYAIYIVVVNKSSLRMSSVKLTFYVLLFGLFTIYGYTLAMGETVQLLVTPKQWLYATQLALMPTVLSLVLMVIAVHDIGSTPTAIMGAIEPITAVAIGVIVFGENFTPRLAIGIVLILTAVLLIIGGKEMSPHKITLAISRVGKRLAKTWRWKS